MKIKMRAKPEPIGLKVTCILLAALLILALIAIVMIGDEPKTKLLHSPDECAICSFLSKLPEGSHDIDDVLKKHDKR